MQAFMLKFDLLHLCLTHTAPLAMALQMQRWFFLLLRRMLHSTGFTSTTRLSSCPAKPVDEHIERGHQQQLTWQLLELSVLGLSLQRVVCLSLQPATSQ